MSQNSSTRYRILRDDLQIDKIDRGFRRTFIVKDLQAGTSFEFSSREMDLIELLSEQAIDSEQIDKIIERSSKSASKREFSHLLNRLVSCNLMAPKEEAGETAPPAPQQASVDEAGGELEPVAKRRGRAGRRREKLSRRRAGAKVIEAEDTSAQLEPDLKPDSEQEKASEAKLKPVSGDGLKARRVKPRRRSFEKRTFGEAQQAKAGEREESTVVDMEVAQSASDVGAQSAKAEELSGTDQRAAKEVPHRQSTRRLRSVSNAGSGFKQWSQRSAPEPQGPVAEVSGGREKSTIDAMLRWLWPLKYLLIAAPTLFSFALVYLNWQPWQDVASQAGGLAALLALPQLAFAHTLKQFTLLAAARYFGGQSVGFGRGRLFGLLPYLKVDLGSEQALPWITRVWVILAALASQCLLIAGAVALLAVADGALLQGAAVATMVAAWLVLFSATAPFGASDANRLLQQFIESLATDDAPVSAQIPFWQKGLLVVVHSLCMGGLLFLMFAPLWGRGFSDWQVVGALLVGSLACYWLLRLLKHLNQKRAEALSVGSALPLQTAGGLVVERQSHIRLPKAKPALLLFALLLVVPWLPYQLDVAGEFTVLPFERQEIHTQVAGLIDEVYFDGGERVAENEVIARLEGYEYEKDARITEARIAEAQAELDKLLNSPRPEEVALAQKRLEVAKVRARFSEEELARYEELYRTASVSLAELESMRRQKEVDAMKVLEEQANLELVLSGAHPKEIAAMEAEIERYQAEARYYRQQLERTYLRMPFTGRILTLHLKQRVGQYLNKGDLFAEVEKSDDYLAEVLIAEYDAAEVSEGAEVRMKSWVYPDHTFIGHVVTIDPVVVQGDYGSQLRLIVSFENPAEKLGSGMTGVAKIGAGDQPVWEVFSRMVVRFFSIEVWSWLP